MRNDDGAGVSSLLETARALARGSPAPQRRRVRVHRRRGGLPLRRGGVRGSGAARGRRRASCSTSRHAARAGPSIMFETSAATPASSTSYADSVPAPGGDQLRGRGLPDPAQRHRLHPVPRRPAASPASTRAYIDGSAAYHSPEDRPSYLDKGACSTTAPTCWPWPGRSATADLAALRRPSNGDATYFPRSGCWCATRAGWSGRWPFSRCSPSARWPWRSAAVVSPGAGGRSRASGSGSSRSCSVAVLGAAAVDAAGRGPPRLRQHDRPVAARLVPRRASSRSS